jgi:hypothetical protein
MAKIVLSDDAPNEAIHFSLAQVEFDLGGKSDKGAFETSDPVVLADAAAHPWLSVERDAEDVYQPSAPSFLRPEDDVLSAVNSVAFDPEAIRAVEEGKIAADQNRLAIDAGLDQNKPVSTDTPTFSVAETLAADDDHEAAKSAKNFKGTE